MLRIVILILCIHSMGWALPQGKPSPKKDCAKHLLNPEPWIKKLGSRKQDQRFLAVTKLVAMLADTDLEKSKVAENTLATFIGSLRKKAESKYEWQLKRCTTGDMDLEVKDFIVSVRELENVLNHLLHFATGKVGVTLVKQTIKEYLAWEMVSLRHSENDGSYLGDYLYMVDSTLSGFEYTPLGKADEELCAWVKGLHSYLEAMCEKSKKGADNRNDDSLKCAFWDWWEKI